MKIFDKTFDAIARAMDLRYDRHKILAGNVANSETPNYRGRELDFSGELERLIGSGDDQLKKTNALHMDIGGNNSAHIVLDQTSQVGPDGNNVDLDVALGKMSANVSAYNAAAQYMTMKLRILRTTASGRGGA